VVPPVDGSVVGSVHEFTHDEIDQVFVAALGARPRWHARPATGRADLLRRFADRLAESAAGIGHVLMMEVAKPGKDARGEVIRSADHLRHTAEDAKRIIGESQFSDSFPGQARNKPAVLHRVPLGTVLAIPPFDLREKDLAGPVSPPAADTTPAIPADLAAPATRRSPRHVPYIHIQKRQIMVPEPIELSGAVQSETVREN
jgi:glyceraldehyde-3-phosphate dehydrogenase (NADP+)